ncbi:hypothetical protein M9458_055722 [Cirrhinus mrigala]|uniref:Uncharacterized protein n=1 Tax=Cirrhinus mrigala TaxID=683832 RepID=A0ABD0MII5_CIRMR
MQDALLPRTLAETTRDRGSAVLLDQVSRLKAAVSETSVTSCSASCNGQAASGSWKGPRLQRHESLRVASSAYPPLVLTDAAGQAHASPLDTIATVVYTYLCGGLCSRRMLQLARHLLFWSLAANIAARRSFFGESNAKKRATLPENGDSNPGFQLVWSRLSDAQVFLFASSESSYCWLVPDRGLGRHALAHSWTRGLRTGLSFPEQILC